MRNEHQKWIAEMNIIRTVNMDILRSDLQVNETLIYGDASTIMLTNTLILITPEIFLLSLDDLIYLSFWLNLALFC